MTHIFCKPLLLVLALCMSLSMYGITLRWGLSVRQGDRPTMEDTHVYETTFGKNGQEAFFAVYDGHGGKKAADIAAQRLHVHLNNSDRAQAIDQKLRMAFANTESEICAQTQSGTCAVIANITDTHAHIAWAGDSRALIIRDGKIIFATTDHKPTMPVERARIEAVGGVIGMHGVARVAGLAVSRALGDLAVKQKYPGAVIAEPQIHSELIKQGDVLVLACDGIWDVLDNEQVGELVADYLFYVPKAVDKVPPLRYGGKEILETSGNDTPAERVARIIRDMAYVKGSSDNLSVQIVKIQ
jgi:serine/threonine protein phosphatase PrpC